MTGLLVVAQCPKPGPPPPRPLHGSASLGALARLAAVDPDDVYARAHLVNLLPSHPGNRWPLDDARQAAWSLLAGDRLPGRVVLLGSAVRAAFRWWLPDLSDDWFTWTPQHAGPFDADRWWATSPHPSGLSRSWKSADVRRGGETFWRGLLADAAVAPLR